MSLRPSQQRTAFGVDLYTGEEDALRGGTRASQEHVERYLNGTSLASDIIPLSLMNPNYGESQPSQYDVQFRPERSTEQQRNGAYVLNELAWDKFTLVAGARFDKFEDTSNGIRFEDENVSLRFGAIYKVKENVSVYGQWAIFRAYQVIG